MARGGDPRRRRRPRRTRPSARRSCGATHVIPMPSVEAIDQAPHLRWVQLPVRRDRELRRPPRRRVHVDVRQGRLRRAGRRDGVDARPSPGCATSGSTRQATTWSGPAGRNLLDARVTILGGGGITESLVGCSQPWNCHITVVRNHAQHMDGVDDVLESDRFADALPGADLVVLALALTPETDGLFGRDEFEMMEDHAWIVNVARGRHIITDHLVEALQTPHDRWRRARCHRSRAAAGRAPAVERCRTASSPPTSATRRRWPSRCWRRG